MLDSRDGAILVNKPVGLTSFQVVAKLRKHFHLPQVGHTGTLDPMATGLLVVLCGRATRLQDLLMGTDKVYSGTIQLGIQTSSDDISGEVISRRSVSDVLHERDREQILRDIKKKFSGTIEQIPPLISAVHVAGERSYRRAMRGEIVVHKPRLVSVEFLELSWQGTEFLRYVVRVSKGTYIRSLARDIGQMLGVGAAIASIHREQSGTFHVKDAKLLGDLLQTSDSSSVIIPIEQLVADLPRAFLSPAEWELLTHGDQRTLRRFISPEFSDVRLIALFRDDLRFAGLIEKRLEPQIGLAEAWKLRFLRQ